jgi:hypothetical protein
VRLACQLGHRDATAEQGFNVREVLSDGDFVALPLVAFVPLIVVVENQREYVVEVFDKLVRRGGIDEAVDRLSRSEKSRKRCSISFNSERWSSRIAFICRQSESEGSAENARADRNSEQVE